MCDAPPGIGAASSLRSVISSIGDVLFVYALLFEEAGVPRGRIVELLDALADEADDCGVPDRAIVPLSLARRLVVTDPTRRPFLWVIDGGRRG